MRMFDPSHEVDERLVLRFDSDRARIAAAILLLAFAARLIGALCFPNDAPFDSVVYMRIARNIVDHHIYASEAVAPYSPCFFRMPGYPMFLAAVYALFGEGAATATRVLQSVIDTGTAWLVAWLAYLWSPRAWTVSQRKDAALTALLCSALCPFVAIHVTSLLTEVVVTFTWAAALLAATIAFAQRRRPERAHLAWLVTGITCGVATLLRPDSGLLVASIGLGLLATGVLRGRESLAALRASFVGAGVHAFLLSLGFVLVLAPWTLRNALVFGEFLPIPMRGTELVGPQHGAGFGGWVTTWLDDFRYVEPFIWDFEARPFELSDVPPHAFDDEEEKRSVAALFERYNHPSAAVLAKDPTLAHVLSQDIDDEFAVIAKHRIARHPFRNAVVLPARRLLKLWFDTHSDYYPFAGHVFPLRDAAPAKLPWLVLFVTLIWFYTLAAVSGGLTLLRDASRRPVLIVIGLVFATRMALLATLGNPEPRYILELFPVLCALSGIAWTAQRAARRAARNSTVIDATAPSIHTQHAMPR